MTEIRRTVQHTGHYVWKKESAEYLIPTEVQPAYEPAVVERYRFEEIIHEDVEMVRRFGAEFRRADESYVSALSLMAPVLRAAAVRRDGR